MTADCTHPSGELTERGTIYCADCRCEVRLSDGAIEREPEVTDGPMEYVYMGRAGTERCSDCLGHGTIYPSDATCHECSGTGRVAWRAYLIPPPLSDYRMNGVAS